MELGELNVAGSPGPARQKNEIGILSVGRIFSSPESRESLWVKNETSRAMFEAREDRKRKRPLRSQFRRR